VRVTLWDGMAERATELASGTAVEVVDGYVRERDGDLELHVGDRGAVEEIDETVEYDPEATPIDDAEIGQTIDIAGVVRSTDPKRTFERDDGSEGQVRNVRLQDDSGDIRVALWGDLADLDIAPGDELLAADVEIQDGWQDDLEASAGWQSTVVVLDDATTTGGGGADAGQKQSESAVSDGGDAGLDAFADGTSPDTAEEGGGTGEGGDVVEFTGTVVQTGEPVVLDDGTETMSVDTDATLRLGEEVTVRGELRDERLDADDVF
jgi:replication factor A1